MPKHISSNIQLSISLAIFFKACLVSIAMLHSTVLFKDEFLQWVGNIYFLSFLMTKMQFYFVNVVAEMIYLG